jgi:hypothetical protein
MIVLLGASSASVADDREWIVTPYLWGADTSLDMLVRDDPVFSGDLDFSDLVDKLDFAFQIHVETRKDGFGLFFDGTVLETSDGIQRSAAPLPGSTTIDTGADLTILEVGGFYRPSGQPYGFDMMLGVRSIDLDIDLTLTPPSPLPVRNIDGSASLLDGFVGLRYSAPLGGNWLVIVRGDVGTGDSDLSYNLSGLLGYRFGADDRYSLLFGYRHFTVEYEESDGSVPVEVDMTMSGPELGFAFRF